MTKNNINGVWRTVGGRRIFIKDGQDLATAMKESGKFKPLKGLSANSSNAFEKHPKPILLEKIDINNTDIDEVLKKYEKNIVYDKIENAIVITKEGEVYQCFGNKTNVWPDEDLGEKIQGAYVTHNHLIEETMFSFSDADVKLFEKYELKTLRGVDEKYTYEFNRTKDSILQIPKDYMTKDFGYEHLLNIQYSIDNNIYYMRWKNNE